MWSRFADGFDTDTSVKRKFVKARTDLTLTVQKEVLPKYGFEGSPKGVPSCTIPKPAGDLIKTPR